MKLEPQNGGNATVAPQTTEIPLRLQLPSTGIITSGTNTIRRDSSCSNASSFYYSMKSTDVSRRSSQASQYSNILSSPPNAANGYGMQQLHRIASRDETQPFYDPISPGSSRRSSEMSTVTTGGYSLAPPVSSSHLLSLGYPNQNYAGARQRFYGNRCSVPSIAPLSAANEAGFGQFGFDGASFDRRSSEPVKSNNDNNMLLSPKHRPRSVTPKSATVVKPANDVTPSAAISVPQNIVEPTPELDLDGAKDAESSSWEEWLLPEECKNFLNQMAEDGNNAGKETSLNTAVPAVPAASVAPANATSADDANKNQTTQTTGLSRSIWRDPSSNLYPISPITQPQSPSSITYAIPSSPQTSSCMATPTMLPPNMNKSPYHQPYAAASTQYTAQYYNPNVPNNGLLPDYNDHMQSSGVAQSAMSQPFIANGGFATGVQHQFNQPNVPENACTQMPGYYHRTDQSAMNCCQLMRALQINDDTQNFIGLKTTTVNKDAVQMTTSTTTTTTTTIAATTTTTQQMRYAEPTNAIGDVGLTSANAVGDIQCGDISQSQLSPAVQPPNLAPQTQQVANNLYVNNAINANANVGAANQTATTMLPPQMQSNFAYNPGMRQDTYQRTLEYVQNCREWTESTETVTSSTHPLNNMTISDMTTSLNSLIEENRYLQMQQTIQ